MFVINVAPFGLDDRLRFGLADGIARQISEDILRSSLIGAFHLFDLFEHVMDTGQQFGIGHGAHSLRMGVSVSSSFVVKGWIISIPLEGSS